MAIITGQMSQSSFKKDGGEIEDESADLDTWRVSLSSYRSFYGEQSGNYRNLRGSTIDRSICIYVVRVLTCESVLRYLEFFDKKKIRIILRSQIELAGRYHKDIKS